MKRRTFLKALSALPIVGPLFAAAPAAKAAAEVSIYANPPIRMDWFRSATIPKAHILQCGSYQEVAKLVHDRLTAAGFDLSKPIETGFDICTLKYCYMQDVAT